MRITYVIVDVHPHMYLLAVIASSGPASSVAETESGYERALRLGVSARLTARDGHSVDCCHRFCKTDSKMVRKEAELAKSGGMTRRNK